GVAEEQERAEQQGHREQRGPERTGMGGDPSSHSPSTFDTCPVPSCAMSRRLAELTTLRLGGPAERFVEARDEHSIVAAVRDAEPPVLVLAGGSNLVVADAGFPGTVVHVLSRGVEATG